MVRPGRLLPDNAEFVILSFEGPDRYSSAGGLGVRVDNLSSSLAAMGYTVHVFFIGDPELPGEEVRSDGKLILHRWCQWISHNYPGGVYEGEEAKRAEFTRSLPDYVKEKIVRPAVRRGKLVAVLGEEWQTAELMSNLSDALHFDGLRAGAVMFWNANNTYSFDRINWNRLAYTATITTVSRYMKRIMISMGLNPVVIPNGIPDSLLSKVDSGKVERLRRLFGSGMLTCKVARWSPDKRWDVALGAAARLKSRGVKSTLVARGGLETYGRDVLLAARAMGLTVREARTSGTNFDAYLTALADALPADIINVRFHMPPDFMRVLYCASNGVLANSGHEPFGIVGLEAMAAGGIAFTGGTGEDYAIPYVNSFVLESGDPDEVVGYLMYLHNYPEDAARMRNAARITASYFTWDTAIRNLIARLENQAREQGILEGVSLPGIPKLNFNSLAGKAPKRNTANA